MWHEGKFSGFLRYLLHAEGSSPEKLCIAAVVCTTTTSMFKSLRFTFITPNPAPYPCCAFGLGSHPYDSLRWQHHHSSRTPPL